MNVSRRNVDRIAKRIVADELRAATAEIVLCAAVRASNGRVVSGYRHFDAIRTLKKMLRYEDDAFFDVSRLLQVQHYASTRFACKGPVYSCLAERSAR
jgi:hypothetical protein